MECAGRGFAGLDEYRPCRRVCPERIINLLRKNAAPPFDLDLAGDRAMSGNKLAPTFTELAAVNVNGVIGRIEQIRDDCFHRTRTARGEQDDLLARTKEGLELLTSAVQGRAEFRGPVMNHWP